MPYTINVAILDRSELDENGAPVIPEKFLRSIAKYNLVYQCSLSGCMCPSVDVSGRYDDILRFLEHEVFDGDSEDELKGFLESMQYEIVKSNL